MSATRKNDIIEGEDMIDEAIPVPDGFKEALLDVRDRYLEELPRGAALQLAELWTAGVVSWETIRQEGAWWVAVSITTADGVMPVFEVRLDQLGFELTHEGYLRAASA